MKSSTTILNIIAGCGLLLMSTSCNGVFDDIYDKAPAPAEGDLYIDASSWTKWHYINLHELRETVENGEKAKLSITTMDIPLTDSNDFDKDSTGIFTYWYDVFGKGITSRERRSYYATIPQPEPEHWDLAFHRNNIRTNGGEVLETSLKDINQVGTASLYATLPFVADSWNETDVWTVQDRMLEGLIGNQRIKINNELGKWLSVNIPPMPPIFSHADNVFIVRFNDGTCCALRLKSYINEKNVKCCLTIEYKYPL